MNLKRKKRENALFLCLYELESEGEENTPNHSYVHVFVAITILTDIAAIKKQNHILFANINNSPFFYDSSVKL